MAVSTVKHICLHELCKWLELLVKPSLCFCSLEFRIESSEHEVNEKENY